MVYLVLMSLNVSNPFKDNFIIERLVDFGTKLHFEIKSDCLFDDIDHIINEQLPSYTFIEKFPEAIRIYKNMNINDIDLPDEIKKSIIRIPLDDENL